MAGQINALSVYSQWMNRGASMTTTPSIWSASTVGDRHVRSVGESVITWKHLATLIPLGLIHSGLQVQVQVQHGLQVQVQVQQIRSLVLVPVERIMRELY